MAVRQPSRARSIPGKLLCRVCLSQLPAWTLQLERKEGLMPPEKNLSIRPAAGFFQCVCVAEESMAQPRAAGSP